MRRQQKQERPQRSLDDMFQIYLDTVKDTKTSKEFEIKFGTKGKNAITKIKYQNVMKRLLSLGFKPLPNTYMLRIMNEFVNKDGETYESNMRTELEGFEAIQTYCSTNEIMNRTDGAIQLPVQFMQKQYPKTEEGVPIYPVDVMDYNFRASLANETVFMEQAGMVKQTIEQWNESKKTFRYLNRVRFEHTEYPLFVDCSIVKTSKKRGFKLLPEYTIQESNVFNNMEGYEIEIEMDNQTVHKDTPQNVLAQLKKVIKYVLSGLQESNYPIGFREEQSVIREYMRLIQHRETDTRRIKPRDFIGPSSKTLHIKHIQLVDEELKIPNIRNQYTVTDKADGQRKMLYISKNGKLYFITTTMHIQFTGAHCKDSKLFETLIDGEHILHNKQHRFIHLYAPFDIYYINGQDVRAKPFELTDSEEAKKSLGHNHRLSLLIQYVDDLKQNCQLRSLRVEVKQFRFGKDIFLACRDVLTHTGEPNFEYETDGLIFTPANLGVGESATEKRPLNRKITWEHSFKWKPAKYNTIDFYVTTNKNADGKEIVEYKYQDGLDVHGQHNIVKYKTLTLRVGFDAKRDGYLNPCMDVIQDNIPKPTTDDNQDGYKPVGFSPTDPYDPGASQCNIELSMDSHGNEQMITEEGEVFADNMIVECRYDINREGNWRWVPLRVRWDKTAELRSGFKNFGNAYYVANDNWHSIHYPVTPEMIASGKDIPESVSGGEDTYYVRLKGESYTEHLRDFHNKYVKKMLITKVGKPGDTLIDLAVGKGGDLSKWIDARLSFVFGIDLSNDNIHNRLDGACARYLNYRKRYKTMPHALFVQGNSGENIKDNTGIFTERGKMVTNSVFGSTEKNEEKLGKGVYRQYGKGVDGFQVCSCQFAIHYFFESKEKVHQFLKNVTETTKVGGYFVGTSYDGARLFKELSKKKMSETLQIYHKGYKLWEIVKQYAETEFLNDDSSIGYAVDVYQETIGKMFREYLVNYDYLIQLIENYGFVLVSNEEAKQMRLPSGTGLFSDLYNDMRRYHKQSVEYQSALRMTADEKRISFLNRYFVFKKVRTVNADTIYMPNTKYQEAQEQMTKEEIESVIQSEEAVMASIPPSGLVDQPKPEGFTAPGGVPGGVPPPPTVPSGEVQAPAPGGVPPPPTVPPGEAQAPAPGGVPPPPTVPTGEAPVEAQADLSNLEVEITEQPQVGGLGGHSPGKKVRNLKSRIVIG